ncbi:hypothetical protein [Brevundimonas poindexterae]|uniref:hypothetical protein n=1 Tax=Brevundimonas poindexterae TaxID=74325 RepID=UPI001CFC7FDB|nr:hypothetical protein [Brevundimonas poindexterae]
MVVDTRKRALYFRDGEVASRFTFDMAASASRRFDLADPEAWHSDFMLGFLCRHAVWGMNLVHNRIMWWNRIDLLRPNDALPIAADIVLLNAPSRLPVDEARARLRFAELIPVDIERYEASDFGKGIWTADRILFGALAHQFSDDPCGTEIHRAYKQFKTLPGRRPRTIEYNFRHYKWIYDFAVAKVVGPLIFGKDVSERDAAQRLGFDLSR